MREVHVSARSVEAFEALLGEQRIRSLERRAEAMRATLGSRAIWNISSTATGGGVAEMLRSIMRYARGLDIDVRWLILEAPPDFFRVTKRVHNALHANAGDGSPLGPEQAALFEEVSRRNVAALHEIVRPNDIVVCHDPQTAGLVPHLVRKGPRVVWRCHIGHEAHELEVDRGWDFLKPYLQEAPLAVFSRAAYAPSYLKEKRSFVLPPTIDPFSAKNQAMSDETVRAILARVGLIEGSPEGAGSTYVRDDGSIGRVDRTADIVRTGHAPKGDTPLVVQVSRWDAIKDPVGVLTGFARLVAPEAPRRANLVLAGPNVCSVADDPEGAEVFAEVQKAFFALPAAARSAVHLAMLPMEDEEENAAIVNALQRHAAVIVQKSLMEGFGLTVAEAMWKRRPVVASAVGGIVDQIQDGVDGILVRKPADPEEFAGCIDRVLRDSRLAENMGNAAYERVRTRSLTVSALENWATLIEQMLAIERTPRTRSPATPESPPRTHV